MLNRSLGTDGVFFIYGVICILGCVLVIFFVPETRGCSLEEIESQVIAH
jgi:SP family sugar porter-like MFS transporter